MSFVVEDLREQLKVEEEEEGKEDGQEEEGQVESADRVKERQPLHTMDEMTVKCSELGNECECDH